MLEIQDVIILINLAQKHEEVEAWKDKIRVERKEESRGGSMGRDFM